MTVVPAAQYVSGRKSSRVSLNQCPTISTAGSAVTVIAFSTAARSDTACVKSIDTGMPTPEVEFASGVK